MTKQFQIDVPGGADCLKLRDVELPDLKPDEVRIRHSYAGVNFVDIYHRKGLYPLPTVPGVPGVEATGTVATIGSAVTGFKTGDQVAYAGGPAGSYTVDRNVPASRLVKLPEDLSEKQIAGSLLRGMTAWLLTEKVLHIRPGQTVLVHAAAGGLGLLLLQLLKRKGAIAIGTVSSGSKAQLAETFGLDHAVLYRDQDFMTAVLDLTGGRGVDHAIDGIGGETLAKTLKVTASLGTVANIGQVGGAVPPLDIGLLTDHFLIRPSVLAFLSDTERHKQAAEGWFSLLRDEVMVSDPYEYDFFDTVRAHIDLETGNTAGGVRLKIS